MATNHLGHVKVMFGLIAMTGMTALTSVANASPVPSGSAMNTLLSQANLNLNVPSAPMAPPVTIDRSQTRPLPAGSLEKLPNLKKNPITGAADNGVCNGGGCAADSLPGLDKVSNPMLNKLQPVMKPVMPSQIRPQ